jgi:hypothetical protein
MLGQAAVEAAVIFPVFFALSIAGLDLSRMNSDATSLAAGARDGMRIAITSSSADVGSVIRAEPAPLIPNNSGVWGVEAAGSADACGSGSTYCGDPSGCAVGSAFWSNGGSPTRCFSVTYCTGVGSPATSCGSYPASWGTLPAIGHAAGVETVVIVVARYAPIVPALLPFTTGGYIYSTQELWGTPLY